MKTRDEKGKFLPGHHIGRPKGSLSKNLYKVKEKFEQLLDGYPVEQMQADLMEMEAGERLRLVVSMLDFFMPKLNRVDNSLNLGSETIIVLPNSIYPIIQSEEENTNCESQIDQSNDNRFVESENIQSGLSTTTEG